MPTWVTKLIRLVVISTIIGYFLHSYLYFSETGMFANYFSDVLLGLSVFLFANIIGTSIYIFNGALNNIPFLSAKNNSRLIFTIVLNYLLLTVLLILIFIVYLKWFTNETSGDLLLKYNELLFRIFVLGFVIIFLFAIIDFSIRSYQKFSQISLNTIKSAKEQAELQLEAFKSQLSPHYLFNNLNTISLLVYKDPKLSEKYIRKLSQTYDYIIETNKKDLVKLCEELEFIKAYKYLLDIRFQNNLQININVADSKGNLFLPPLSIQILIENAVKHNSPTDDDQLDINIELAGEYLQVKNNLLRTPTQTDSFKIGLDNIRKRYKFHTNKEIIIDKNSMFMVRIPLLKYDKSKQFHDVLAMV
ncbi:MAG: hypothetical protein DRJ07_06110 [Bacteroidetes bacterium]|nr:MAG: hypothetical protein DRJ07_06110 [Bacteroidota bacterium]